MNARRGLTLLEIVLALAIAAIAMSLLAQLVSIGNRSAAAARDQTKAQLIAESIMAEYASGVKLPDSGGGVWEMDPTWSYTADIAIGSSDNLNIITVTVAQDESVSRPASFTLTQWLWIAPEPEEETESTETEGV